MSRITLTGSDGFIGSHVTFVGNGVDLKRGQDICDMTWVGDLVIHLAAVSSIPKSFDDPAETYRTNITGLLHVIELCKKHDSKLVFASSSSVQDPQSPYAYSKKWGEELIIKSGIDYCILRLGNVYGEGDNKSAINAFKTNDSITIYGDGKQKRDFVYVGDVVQALKQAESWRGIFNIGHEKMTINEVAKLFNKPVSHAPERAGDALDLTQGHKYPTSWKPTVKLKDWIAK